MIFNFFKINLTIFLLLLHTNAHAYIGPGMGGGILITIIGIIVAILIAIIGFIYYPIKRLIKKTGKAKNHKK